MIENDEKSENESDGACYARGALGNDYDAVCQSKETYKARPLVSEKNA